MAFIEAREKDWQQVGKARYDTIPSLSSHVENSAETCAWYWSKNRWAGRSWENAELEIVAPNRFKWAQEWAYVKPPTLEYQMSIPAGISFIHVPLKATAVDGVATTIESIGDLYLALGGADAVNFLITYDSQAGEWLSYFGPTDKGGVSDKVLTDDMGIIAGLIAPVSMDLTGTALGINGSSTLSLSPGLNLVGLPLKDSALTRVSDLLELDGIRGNVPVIILTDGGDFQPVGRAGDPGDVPITGEQGFILTAQQPAQVTITGQGWTNTSGVAAAPQVALKGVTDTTAILALRGAVIDEGTGLKGDGLRVIAKNLSTGKTITGLTTGEGAGYRLTVVDIETARAAMVGDVLEISARSVNPPNRCEAVAV